MSYLVPKLASYPFVFNMSERSVDTGSIDNFIAEQENKATLQETKRDVKLVRAFFKLRMKVEKLKTTTTAYGKALPRGKRMGLRRRVMAIKLSFYIIILLKY